MRRVQRLAMQRVGREKRRPPVFFLDSPDTSLAALRIASHDRHRRARFGKPFGNRAAQSAGSPPITTATSPVKSNNFVMAAEYGGVSI